MLNRVVLIGRLTRDAELRYTPQGQAVATLGIAVDRMRGKGDEVVDFIELVLWRRLAEALSEHLRKGRLVGVEGRLQIRRYEAKDGTPRKASEVVVDSISFLDAARPVPGGAPKGGAGEGGLEGQSGLGMVPKSEE